MNTLTNLINEILSSPEYNNLSDDELKQMIDNIASSIKQSYMDISHQVLQEFTEYDKQFSKRNYERWKKGFDLLHVLIILCTELGDIFNSAYRPKAVENQDLVFDILTRHHASACQIANEIFVLLLNGYPDGANARWRSLHELNVTATFINKHGQNCAERFFSHKHIESKKAADIHHEYEVRINEKGPTEKDREKLNCIYAQLLSKYGHSYKHPYGWAIKALNKDLDKGKCNFGDIERDTHLDHWRPYYKTSSQNIHSCSKHFDPKLKLALKETDQDVLLTGSSNSGMTHPSHSTAISLTQITTLLLSKEPNLDNIIHINVISKISDEIGETFLTLSNKPHAD